MDVRAVLEDYLDGELEGELSASLQLHFGHCTECKEQLDLMRSEQHLYRNFGESLQRALDPPPGMWPAIRREVLQDKPVRGAAGESVKIGKSRFGFPAFLFGHWLPQAGLAALLVVVSIAGTLLYVQYRGKETPDARSRSMSAPLPSVPFDRPNPDPWKPAKGPSGDGGLEAAVQAIQRAEQEYIQAIQLLSAIVDQRKSSLQAELVQEMERNLRSIDESIRATRDAYYSHPRDAYLAQYMLAAYSKKVELLQELAS